MTTPTPTPATEAEAMRAAIVARAARDYGPPPPSEKLVRDRIPMRHPEHAYRRAAPHEMDHLLRAKVREEAAEVADADDDALLGELADLHEVTVALARLHGWGLDDVLAAADQKRRARGGFADGWVLVRPGGATAGPQRPQERPEGGSESPAASEAPNGPQAGAESLDALREEIITAVRALVGSQWISSGNGRTYQTDYGRVADAVLAVVQPRLDAAHRRAEQAEAAIARVRRIHTHGPRTNTCNEDGANWPCDTIRALDGTDTKETP